MFSVNTPFFLDAPYAYPFRRTRQKNTPSKFTEEKHFFIPGDRKMGTGVSRSRM